MFTDFNTINFFSNMESRIRFIKLIINTFNVFFKVIYEKDSKYNKDNMNIMFKGGTVIRLVIMEYI